MKKNRKLRLNRETIRFLDSGLERAAGGVTLQCATEEVCSSTPDCDTNMCGGGGTGNCNTVAQCSIYCNTSDCTNTQDCTNFAATCGCNTSTCS